MSDNYLLPSEFIALVSAWFAPPSVIAMWFQRKFLRRQVPAIKPTALFSALVATSVISMVLGLAVFVASPFRIGVLWLTSLHLAGHTIPVLPLAYVSVAITATLVSVLTVSLQRRAVT